MTYFSKSVGGCGLDQDEDNSVPWNDFQGTAISAGPAASSIHVESYTDGG